MQATTRYSIYPQCAGDACTNRARGRTPGSLCNSCRRDAGDVSVICEAEGCNNVRLRRGLCEPCFTNGGAKREPRRRSQAGRIQCERPGCKLKRHDHHALCGKHRANWDACVTGGCVQPITANSKCDKHKAGKNGTCTVGRCFKPRFKAQLCYRHYTKNNPETCAREGCESGTERTYCRTHDVGIDFAAGDWFDWVAVDQLWEGRLDPGRKPTVPELNKLFDRADRAGLGTGKHLAERVGVDENRLRSWRQMLGHAERVSMEVAA